MTYIDSWDTGAPGALWDSGLQYDVNVGVSLGDVTPYLDLITSQHRNRPKYIATLTALLEPIVGAAALMERMPSLFDLDAAFGAQLDATGQWIGVTRYLRTPLTGVYFAFDTAGVGFDQGTWSSKFQPTDQFVQLGDDQYRTLLRARIANNQWDGTVPGAYASWDAAFAGTGYGILIQDVGNMRLIYALTGVVPDAVTLALFTGGYLNVKPAGVAIDAYMTPTVPDAPYFGFDLIGTEIAGFDVGAWGKFTPVH